jgi:glycosyltransferase involved in cell wall biosynthesis
MKKKILIDASTVVYQEDGLSHAIINLIKYLPADSFDRYEYTILINQGLQRKEMIDLLKDPKYKVIEHKIAPIGPKRDWNMYWFMRKYGRQFDLVHITSNNYPLALRNGIATVHDITFKKMFDSRSFIINPATTYMDRIIRHALKNSKAIISVSQATKDDLINTYKLNETAADKIHVIHHGWQHLQDKSDENCDKNFSVSDGYLLFVSTFRIHKNITNLLLGFKQAIEKTGLNKKLLLIGEDKHVSDEDKTLINDINQNGEKVILAGYLENSCVTKHFKEADAYIFPSLSEGFGFGVLEAFYYNVPLLCSRSSSLPEIAGNAALYFDPYDPRSIADAIIDFYTKPELKGSLIEKGKERLNNFSWEKNAAQVVRLYDACTS